MDRYNSLPEEAASSVVPAQSWRAALFRVFIVDDFECVRDGLRSYIDAEPDMLLVGEADCGGAALDALLALGISAQGESLSLGTIPSRADADIGCGVDVVVLDVSLPDSDADQVVARIRERWPLTQVLALAVNEDRGSVTNALASGALGYVLKRAPAEEIIRAIRSVADGQTYIDPLLSRTAAEALVSRKRKTNGQYLRSAVSSHQALSRREEQILRLIAEGTTHKEIAAMLNLSVKTVETYKARSMSKRALKSRAEIIRYGASEGWLDSVKPY